MNMEVLGDQFANRFVCRSVYRRSFDFDLVASVGKLRHAFAFATRMYLDVDFHVYAR